MHSINDTFTLPVVTAPAWTKFLGSASRRLEIWDKIVEQNQELEFLENLNATSDRESSEILELVIDNDRRRSALFDKYQENPDALGWVCQNSLLDLDLIWDCEIVPRNLEIMLISHFTQSSVLDDKYRKKELLKKYKDRPQDLASVYIVLNLKNKKRLWKRIVRKDQEIPFLAQVDKPEALSLVDVQWLFHRKRVFHHRKAETRLIKKYQEDLSALAVIWKVLPTKLQKNLWHNNIVRRAQEIEFMSQECLQDSVSKVTLNMLFADKKNALDKMYKDDPEKMAAIEELLIINDQAFT